MRTTIFCRVSCRLFFPGYFPKCFRTAFFAALMEKSRYINYVILKYVICYSISLQLFVTDTYTLYLMLHWHVYFEFIFWFPFSGLFIILISYYQINNITYSITTVILNAQFWLKNCSILLPSVCLSFPLLEYSLYSGCYIKTHKKDCNHWI